MMKLTHKNQVEKRAQVLQQIQDALKSVSRANQRIITNALFICYGFRP